MMGPPYETTYSRQVGYISHPSYSKVKGWTVQKKHLQGINWELQKKKVSAIYEKVNPKFDLTHLGLGPPASHPQAATFATVAWKRCACSRADIGPSQTLAFLSELPFCGNVEVLRNEIGPPTWISDSPAQVTSRSSMTSSLAVCLKGQ